MFIHDYPRGYVLEICTFIHEADRKHEGCKPTFNERFWCIIFYCIKDDASVAHLDELNAISEKLENFFLHIYHSKTEGRLGLSHILEVAGSDLNKTHVSFCGPELMRVGLYKGLKEAGLKPRNFHYEEFEIRSDFGLSRLLELGAKKLQARAMGKAN